ncbi:MAG: adenine phosphoribosyltransferase [Candidatus Aureabacteria bacterium]|nr:adenine phosphoribosyltransferase [Candidatus Auribacterota bacterium]
MSLADLKKAIRDVPDFPKRGIIFKDITPLISDGKLFKEAIDLLAKPFTRRPPRKVVCVDARGFIFGAALALKFGAGVVPVRKAGKLPHKTKQASFDLEYGSATVEIHEDAICPGERVLIVDDLLATGGTLKAAIDLVKHSGGEIIGICVVIELDFLKGREKIKGLPIHSLIHF